MEEWLARQNRLIGETATDKLIGSRVAIIGLGGVGGAVVEGLARAGIGALLVLDCDVFDKTNLNRQLLATCETVGKNKNDIAKQRVISINPTCEVTSINARLEADNLSLVFDFKPDYIVDAIDCVTTKLALIGQAFNQNVKIITCMGTGNRISAEDFMLGDIELSAGNGCGLSRVMRRELRKRGISGINALFAKTFPITPLDGARTPASISFVPPVAGYLLAGFVVRDLIKKII